MGFRQNMTVVSFRWRKTMVAFRHTTVVGFRQRMTVVASDQQQQSWVTVWVSGKTENNRSWPTVDLCLKPTTLTAQHWRSPSKANHCCSPFKDHRCISPSKACHCHTSSDALRYCSPSDVHHCHSLFEAHHCRPPLLLSV